MCTLQKRYHNHDNGVQWSVYKNLVSKFNTLYIGGCLRPFLSLFVLSLLACHGRKGREKGDKKGQKETKRDKKVNLFGKVQADRPHL